MNAKNGFGIITISATSSSQP